MKLRFLSLVSAVAVAAFPAAACAATIYTFSFSNEDGPVAGTVEGTVTLPDGDGVFAASQITVTSAPAALGYTTPFDVFPGFSNVTQNTFPVVGGQIVAGGVEFIAANSTDGLALSDDSSFGIGTWLNTAGSRDALSGVSDFDNSTLVFGSTSTSPIPEPTSVLGLAGVLSLAFTSHRRRR